MELLKVEMYFFKDIKPQNPQADFAVEIFLEVQIF